MEQLLLKIAAELDKRASRVGGGYGGDHDSNIREMAVSDALTILAQVIEDVARAEPKERAND